MEEQQESFKVVINLLELPQKDITILRNILVRNKMWNAAEMTRDVERIIENVTSKVN